MRAAPHGRPRPIEVPVAIYHLSVKPISRGTGRSATAAAAYRAAERIRDELTGETFDYRRKRGVEHAEIVLPGTAASGETGWARDRQQLWNAAERAERRKDARVAREYEVALPHELSAAERLALTRAFAQTLADRFGCAVDLAIHAPHREGDTRNHHAHLLATTRRVEARGLGAKTTIELKDVDRAKLGLGPAKEEVKAIRGLWAEHANAHLAAHGHEARIDHRSLEAQGEAREPTRHLGPALTAMERRGQNAEVLWRLREEANERLALAAELGRIERERERVERSLLDLTGNIAGARADRDAGRTPTYDLEAERQKAREAWLAWRATREDDTAGETPERRPPGKTPAQDDDFSL